jgi:hypothetical protein
VITKSNFELLSKHLPEIVACNLIKQVFHKLPTWLDLADQLTSKLYIVGWFHNPAFFDFLYLFDQLRMLTVRFRKINLFLVLKTQCLSIGSQLFRPKITNLQKASIRHRHYQPSFATEVRDVNKHRSNLCLSNPDKSYVIVNHKKVVKGAQYRDETRRRETTLLTRFCEGPFSVIIENVAAFLR